MKNKILKIFKEAEKVKDNEEKFDECINRLSEMKAKSKEDGTFDEFYNLLVSDEEVIVFMDSLGKKILSSTDRRKKLKKETQSDKARLHNGKPLLKGGNEKK